MQPLGVDDSLLAFAQEQLQVWPLMPGELASRWPVLATQSAQRLCKGPVCLCSRRLPG